MDGHLGLRGGIRIENFEENILNVLVMADNNVDQEFHKAIDGRFLLLAFKYNIFEETSNDFP